MHHEGDKDDDPAEGGRAAWRVPGREELVRQVRAAFAADGRPAGSGGGDEWICRGRSHDCELLREWLRGKSWEQIASVDALAGDLLILHSLSGPAFRYYLPAFLLASLEEREDLLDTGVADVIVRSFLTRPYPDGGDLLDADEAFRGRVEGLTREQAGAVRRYLEYQSAMMRAFTRHLGEPEEAAEDDAAAVALGRYWGEAAGGRGQAAGDPS